MNRNFAILGLSEDATKEQVKQAYDLRVRKYKSSDYDDDPDYVRRKLAELKSAYDAAYSAAGTDRAYENYDERTYERSDYERETSSSDAYEPEVYRPREYKPEKYDHDRFERERDRAARKGEDHRFKTPDISKLRDKMDSLKSTVSENISGLAEDIRESANRANEEAEAPPAYRERTSPNIRRLDDSGSGRIIEPESEPQPVSPPRLDDSGYGGVIQTPTGADTPIYKSSGNSAVKGGSAAGVIIAILVGIIMLFTSMCDDGDDYSYYDDYDDSSYSYEYISTGDERVYNTAIDVNDLLYEQNSADSYAPGVYSDDDVKKEADKFAKNYLDMESLEDVTEYLYNTYGEFATYIDDPYEEQMTQILAFYGFMSESDAEGRINPYTDKPITDFVKYLKYINKYYRENGLTEESDQ